jgi:DNA-binding transcriptional regulator PaaX
MRILRALVPGKPVVAGDIIRELGINNGYQLMRFLRSHDLIEESIVNDLKTVSITEKGIKKTLIIDIENLEIKHSKKWDGQWRIVFFDIPEKYKTSRDALTSKLKMLGFKQIQKSVYVFPFECFEEIEKLRCFYNIRPYTFLITANKIEGAEKLIKLFKLH